MDESRILIFFGYWQAICSYYYFILRSSEIMIEIKGMKSDVRIRKKRRKLVWTHLVCISE